MSAAARGRPQLCISSANQSPAALGASLISQGVPSSKTVHWTIFEFTPCGGILSKEISPSADGENGALPPGPLQAFEKA